MFEIISILSIVIGIALFFVITIRQYQKTEYFKETEKPFFEMRRDKGAYGEYLIVKCLAKLNGHKRFVINAYIPKQDGGTTEIDIVMLHSTGVYVFESKNMSGWIFGSEKQPQWTQSFPNGQKFKFFNPCMQNAAHIKNLVNFCDDITNDMVVSVIVFSKRCALKKVHIETKRHIVTKRESLLLSMKTLSDNKKFDAEKIDKIYEMLKAQTKTSGQVKEEHIQHVKSIQAQQICPYCKSELVLRTAKGTGRQFYGCSGFPKCKYTAKPK